MSVVDLNQKRTLPQADHQRVYDGCMQALMLVSNLRAANPEALAYIYQAAIPKVVNAAAKIVASMLGVDQATAANHVLSILFVDQLFKVGGYHEESPLSPSR